MQLLSPRSWLDRAMDLLAPETCAACDDPVERGQPFCPRCGRDVTNAESRSFSEGIPIIAAARYSGPVAEAVKRLKYSDRPDVACRLGRWMAERVAPEIVAGSTCLVPVPLHPRRLASRGFNQSALLAREAARCWHAPMYATALRRIRDTPQQAALGRDGRIDNVRDAFVARRPLAGRRVVLFDDVVTTGATAYGCVEALRQAGGKVVAVTALAEAGAHGAPRY